MHAQEEGAISIFAQKLPASLKPTVLLNERPHSHMWRSGHKELTQRRAPTQ